MSRTDHLEARIALLEESMSNVVKILQRHDPDITDLMRIVHATLPPKPAANHPDSTPTTP